jgi:hypothetical protein
MMSGSMDRTRSVEKSADGVRDVRALVMKERDDLNLKVESFW